MNRQITKNLITNIIAMVISLGINYLITPFITKKLGIAAYSYVSIITNIISFFTVITYTLNSMVGRFYTIEYRSDEHEANVCISTALYCCLGIAVVLLPIIILSTLFLDKLLVIDLGLVSDVKFAFFASCITFLLSTISSVMLTGTYAKNKLHINNYIHILANSIKAIVIFILFYACSAKIWFIGLGGIAQNVISITLGYICFKKYIPTLKFEIKNFKFSYAKKLLGAGMYNSIILLGNNLMTQVDMIVGNRYIKDATVLGKYAVILLFSNTIRQVSSTISSAFNPTTLNLYAQKKYDELVKCVNNAVNLCGTIIGLAVTGITILVIPFVSIWLKEDFSEFSFLIPFMLLSLVPNLAIAQLNVLNQAVNKLKLPAIASIIAGVLNIVLAVTFVRVFNFGLFGLALASVISLSLRNMVFAPIYAAKITNQRWFVYYKPLLRSFIVSAIVSIAGLAVTSRIDMSNLSTLVFAGIIIVVIYIAFTYTLLNKNEKHKIKDMIIKYAGKKN